MATILCIDDSPLVLRILERTLQNANHEVLCAEDWAEVRALLKEEELDIDCVLVDVVLPGFQSGAAMARSLKLHPKLRKAKIIFYSSKPLDFLEKQAKMLRLHGYINKETKGAALCAKIHEILYPPEEEEGDAPPPPLQKAPVKPLPKPSEAFIRRWRK